MTDEELAAYSRGQCDAYNAVFKAFTAAFNGGHDIHWLRGYIGAQWKTTLAMQSEKGVL